MPSAAVSRKPVGFLGADESKRAMMPTWRIAQKIHEPRSYSCHQRTGSSRQRLRGR
jgi:hypothetical protein